MSETNKDTRPDWCKEALKESAKIETKEQELWELKARRKSLNEEIVKRAIKLGYAVIDQTTISIGTGNYREMFQRLFLPRGGVLVVDAWKLDTVERDEYMLRAAGYLLSDDDEEDKPNEQ
jgi:hypothetical protein